MKKIYTDILVVGAGAAGIAAAVAAAGNGHRVTVVENHNFSGGNATSAEVGTVCGLYHTSFDKPEFLVRGFAREFAEKLQSLSGTRPMSTKDGLHYLPYRVNAFVQLGNTYLSSGNIECFYNCRIEKVNKKDNRIISVETAGMGPLSIFPTVLIDCSGNSVIARLGGLPLISEPVYQAAAQVFTMKGIEEEREDRLSLLLIKAIAKAGTDITIDGNMPKLYLVPGSLKSGMASFKIALPFTIDETSDRDARLVKKARSLVEKVAHCLIRELEAFKQAEIDHIAATPGFRVAARTKGKKVLRGSEVAQCTHFKNGIALCSWPVEEWEEDGKVRMSYLPEYGYYEIPHDCLIAETADNLFMAGRNISADKEAIASARVMGICLQTGYAAGLLAAAKASGISEQEAIENIQRQQMNYL